IQPAAVLEAVKARPGNDGVRRHGGATAGLDSFCARRRRKSAVGAEESLRRGRTKERAQSKKVSQQERKRRYRWTSAGPKIFWPPYAAGSVFERSAKPWQRPVLVCSARRAEP